MLKRTNPHGWPRLLLLMLLAALLILAVPGINTAVHASTTESTYITISHSPSGWTNGNVTVTITYRYGPVQRYSIIGGVSNVTYTGPFTVSSNCTIVASCGPVSQPAAYTLSHQVTNIDKVNPTASHSLSTTAPTNQNVVITLNANDAASGVATIRRPNNTTATNTSGNNAFSTTHTVSSNGTYAFVVTDRAGNSITRNVTVSNIDKTPPAAPTLSHSPTNWTNGNVSVSINYPADAVTRQYRIGSGSWTTYSGAISLTGNNTVYARCYDAAGNVSSTASRTISNIDKTSPTASHYLSTTDPATEVTITIDAADSGSGVASIKRPDNSIVTAASTTYAVSENGSYSFLITDLAGNTYTHVVSISNIDQTITVTHPIAVSWVIDPDSSEPFIAADINLTNQSAFPVKVSIQSFELQTSDLISMGDVTPGAFVNWNLLSRDQTMSNIALGIAISEDPGSSNWTAIDRQEPIYAAEIDEKILLGTLGEGASGLLQLIAKHGLAWDSSYELSHVITFVFEMG